MPRVFVHVPTFRRAHLLTRALDSLRAQTFADWRCEVRNDSPGDPAPARIVATLGDPRIVCIDHPVNLGGIRTFNLLYSEPHPEPYLALLEDDNWWEPAFLATLVALLDAQPGSDLAWTNQTLWREEVDGSWTRLPQCLWRTPAGAEPRSFAFPQRIQLDGHLHANGAMLVRNRAAAAHVVPDSTPFSIVEAVRERTFAGPLWFVPAPLAHLALTRETHRDGRLAAWAEEQVLLMATFLARVPLAPEAWRAIFSARAAARPRSTALLMLAALAARRPGLLRGAGAADWLALVRGFIRRPRISLRALRVRHRHPELWAFLLRHSAPPPGSAPVSAQSIARRELSA